MAHPANNPFLSETLSLQAGSSDAVDFAQAIDFPTPKQNQLKWCWAAISASLCNFHKGQNLSQEYVAELYLGSQFNSATNQETEQHIHKVLKKLFDHHQLDHEFHRVKIDVEEQHFQDINSRVITCLKENYPVPITISWWRRADNPDPGNHYVCIFGYRQMDDLTFLIYDPSYQDQNSVNIVEIPAHRMLNEYRGTARDPEGYWYDAYVPVIS